MLDGIPKIATISTPPSLLKGMIFPCLSNCRRNTDFIALNMQFAHATSLNDESLIPNLQLLDRKVRAPILEFNRHAVLFRGNPPLFHDGRKNARIVFSDEDDRRTMPIRSLPKDPDLNS
jgi:hypothetical protein